MVEADTVAHCGPTAKGEFARTITVTDINTGWTELESVRNNSRRWIKSGLDEALSRFPFPVKCFDTDNGSEFINHEIVDWIQQRDIEFTRSRPYHKNDQATVESKNGHVVRKQAFYWRYDTKTERDLLNQLRRCVSLRLNLFTPTKKPVGYVTDQSGRRKRLYDKPATPLDRLERSGAITAAQVKAIRAQAARINPANLTRVIVGLQGQLQELAGPKTESLCASQTVDLAALDTSINRLIPTRKRKLASSSV